MLKWWSGSSTTTTEESNNEDHDDAVPSFPMPGSIQRAGGGSRALSTSTSSGSIEDDEDGSEEDNDEEDRKAIANLDLFISPPSPPVSTPSSKQSSNNATIHKTANSSSIPSFKVTQQDEEVTSEFKAPSMPSFSLSTASSVPPTSKPKPKPSHRPFPPESSTPQTLNNGRVTFNNSSHKGASLGSSLNLPPSTTVKPRKQRFVALEPGYSPLDWARLNKEGDDDELRYGFDTPQKFTLQEVSEHATKNDAWSIFNGRVYNISPYLHFHPGGVGELMKCAGKDGTELFMKTHAWVNVELMMEGCLIGFLVRE